MSPALAGGFPTTAPPGTSPHLLFNAMIPLGMSPQPVHWSVPSSEVNDFHCVKITKFLPHVVPSERVSFILSVTICITMCMLFSSLLLS